MSSSTEISSTDVFSTIRKRRKCTAFLPKEIPACTLHLIAEMAHSAPTGGGYDSREFIIVTDRNTLRELSKTHEHSAWLSDVAAAIAITGNPGKSRYWLEDCCIAGEHIWLAATALGLGSSWAAIYQSDDLAESQRRKDYVKGLLNIPDNLRPVAILGLGFPSDNQPPKEKSTKRVLDKVLYFNKYGERKKV